MTTETNLSRLIEMAKSVRMSEAQVAEQRNSFVYGNTRTENPTITRDLVDRTAQAFVVDAQVKESGSS